MNVHFFIPMWMIPLALTIAYYCGAQLLARRYLWHDFAFHIELIKNHFIATGLTIATWCIYFVW